MKNGKQLIELAERIPIRNINFYLGACNAMSMVNLQEITESDVAGIQSEIIMMTKDKGLKAIPRAVVESAIGYFNDGGIRDTAGGIKILGKLIATHLRQGEFIDSGGSFTQLPFTFLCYALAEDLKLHGFGPNYYFLENVIDDLRGLKAIDPELCSTSPIRSCLTSYSNVDIAAIFLGYSLARQGALRAIVPVPANPVGFVAVLISELKKLSPRNLEGERFIES